MKKAAKEVDLKLVRTPDIVSAIATSESRPYTGGFAAETNDVLSYARDKMLRKNLDMIVANDVSNHSIGFNSDENAVTVLWGEREVVLGQANKASIARQILDLIGEQNQ